MLSRLTAGIRKKTVIVNFPGSKKAAQECFGFVKPALQHAVDLASGGKKDRVEKVHKELQGGGGCGHRHSSSRVDAANVAGRDRSSPWPMVSVGQAQKTVMDLCDAVGLTTVELSFDGALGRVIAEDVTAKEPLPPFPASIKDGYAVLSADGADSRKVISASSDAGSHPGELQVSPGHCVRINTGGPVPAGADAVVQVEDTKLLESSEDGKEEKVIEILEAPNEGLDIRYVKTPNYE